MDGLPELPVSRIPDAKSSALVLAALAAPAGTAADRYGIRNVARPFADRIWRGIPGQAALLVSQPTRATGVNPAQVAAQRVYFMLHGSDADGTRYWGEGPGGALEAINVGKLPPRFSGVVLAGCCWGALTCNNRAFEAGPLSMKTVNASIALSLVAAGAAAFVGSVGTHYSPDATASFAGGPMHQAFWSNAVAGRRPPAEALFRAKLDYIKGMPHGRTDAFEIAIERKILNEFTCLGLGW